MSMHCACLTLASQSVYVKKVSQVTDKCVWVSISVWDNSCTNIHHRSVSLTYFKLDFKMKEKYFM